MTNNKLLGVAAFARLLSPFCLLAMLSASMPAAAEGSRTLYPATYEAAHTGEGRGNLDLDSSDTYAAVASRRTFLYVYAQAGENILVGSRNRTAAGVGEIRIYNPQNFGNRGNETIPGTASFTCTAGTTGLISTRAQELAGPNSITGNNNPTGYTPCVYTAPSTGIYGVLFGAGSSGGNPDGNVGTPATSTNSVSAWDVTVRSSVTTSTTDLNGRLFTYAWSVYTGGNGNGRLLFSDLGIVTSDAYRYRLRKTGIDPFAGTFFANARGFVDNGEPLYRSLRGADQPVSTLRPAGISNVSADRPDYPIFFSSVDPAGANNAEVERTLTALGIALTPKPPQVNAFRFTYPPVNTSTAFLGMGGTFSFTVTDTISFQIVISRDGVSFDPALATNKVITGSSGTGDYSVSWDGKDNAGNNFPVGNGYKFRITGRNGEAHFPFVDVEGNVTGGPALTKLNGNIQDSLVYYDDRGYVTSGGTAVGVLNGNICGAGFTPTSTPNVNLEGVDSTTNYRSWPLGVNNNSDCAGNTQSFGDTKALNLWTFQNTVPQSSTLDIIDAADVTARVSAPAAATAGSTVLVNIDFGNVGSQNAASTTYSATLPTGLTGVSCTGGTCNYNSTTGVVTISGLPGSLSSGQFTQLGLRYTAPASGSVLVTATVGTSTSQGANLAPDSASAITPIGGSTDADVLTTVNAPATTVAGGVVQVAIGYRNIGASTAAGVTYALTLPTGLTGVSCNNGIVCSYSAGTGAVTVAGLPTSLASGATATAFNLSYTAPASGSVQVTSTIATTSPETNTSNNTANDVTSVQSAGASPVDIAASVSAPASVAPGSVINAAVSFQNVGLNNLTGASYSMTLPTGLTGVSCGSPVVCTYAAGTGAVTVTGVPANLIAGEVTSLNLRYNAPAAGVVRVVATATLAGDGNLSNNTAQADTTIVTAGTGADVTVSVQPPANAAPGATVDVPVVYSNFGPSTANSVQFGLSLPAGLAGVSCSGNGVTCTYAAGSGVVTVNGGPASLANGGGLPFTLSYTAPGSGTVRVNGETSTTTPESNTSNNTDTGVTTIAAATLADVTTTVAPPATATGGSTVSVPVTYRNAGAITAAGVTYDLDLSAGATAISVSYNSVACTYNAGTGAVSGCGLPTSLTPGQTLNLTLSYTAPASGTVTTTSTVTTTTGESNVNNNVATAPTGIASADLSLTKTVNNATPNVGSNVTFTVTVSNAGPSAATGVRVGDQLPAGYTYVSDNGAGAYVSGTGVWTIPGTIASGANVSLQIVARVNASGPYANTAQVTASDQTDPDSTPNNNAPAEDDQATATPVPVPVADLSLTKTVSNATPTVGSNVTFTVTVSNAGPSAATGVRVGDQLPAGYTHVSDNGAGAYVSGTGVWTIPGTIASGANVSLQIVARVNASGPYANTAQVTASDQTDPDSTPNNNNPTEDDQATSTPVPSASADLSVAKTVDNATPNVGSNVTFTVTVSNAGPSAATGVRVGDQLPAGYTYVSDNGAGAYVSGTGVWTIPGTIASGASVSLQIVATVNATGSYANTAQITASDQPDPDSTPNNNDPTEDDQATSTPVPSASADLSLVKTVDNATPGVGSNVTFTLTVSNAGPAAATGVRVVDQLPAGYTFVSDNGAGAYVAGTGVWTIPGTIASGASVSLQIVATVNATGPYANTAQITGSNQPDPDSTPNNNDPTEDDQSTSTPVPVSSMDLSVVKSVSNSTPRVGEVVTFTLLVRNHGPAAATGVRVNDALPTGYSFVSTSAAQGAYLAPVWTVGTMASGTSATLTMQARVLASGNYQNIATVSSDQTDIDPTNDIDTRGVSPRAGVPEIIPANGPWSLLLLSLMVGLLSIPALLAYRRR